MTDVVNLELQRLSVSRWTQYNLMTLSWYTAFVSWVSGKVLLIATGYREGTSDLDRDCAFHKLKIRQ